MSTDVKATEETLSAAIQTSLQHKIHPARLQQLKITLIQSAKKGDAKLAQRLVKENIPKEAKSTVETLILRKFEQLQSQPPVPLRESAFGPMAINPAGSAAADPHQLPPIYPSPASSSGPTTS